MTHLIHFVIPSQWNKPSIDFYEKALGAKSMSEWMGMRLEEEEIANLNVTPSVNGGICVISQDN